MHFCENQLKMASSTRSSRSFDECLNNALQFTKLITQSGSVRESQRKALESIFNEKDCLVMMPTGGGKSLIYQLTPFIKHAQLYGLLNEGDHVKCTTIILSPLNALMKDQVKSLSEKGIKSCYIDMVGQHGHTFVLRSDETDDSEEQENIEHFLEMEIEIEKIHDFTLIYSHPEALLSTTVGKKLLKALSATVYCVAVDEAHMVCEW